MRAEFLLYLGSQEPLGLSGELKITEVGLVVFSRDSHCSLGDGHTLLVRLLLEQVAWELCYFICLKIK